MSIKVAIIDNHPMVIHGLQTMLAPYPHIEIRATHTTGASLLEWLKEELPEVLLLDIMLTDTTGKELATFITQKYPSIRILAITSLDAPAHVKSMMRRGCLGYLLKDTEQDVLIEAIEQVYKWQQFIEPSIREQMLQNVLKLQKKRSDTIPDLTQREKEILQLIVQEYTSQEIADKLFISQRTVEAHRFSLCQKMDVKNLVGLIKVAIQMGLVE
jgi:DNA-binding NarL/FixJ family response regulator